MWPPPVEGEGALALRDLGFRWSRSTGHHSLSLEYRGGGGGSGLMLRAAIGADALMLWMPEPAWCAWISEILPIGTWQDVPEDHVPALAQWTLLPLLWPAQDDTSAQGDADSEAEIEARLELDDDDDDIAAALADSDEEVGPSQSLIAQPEQTESANAMAMPGAVDAVLAPGVIDDAAGWWISLGEGARSLCMRVVEAPAGWLVRLASGMRLHGPAAHQVPLKMTVLAGWTRISTSAWGALSSGDAVLLEPGADPDSGRLWIRYGELCLAMQCEAATDADGDGRACADVTAACTMKLLEAHIEPDWRAPQSEAVGLPCVLAEIGCVHVPADEFAALTAGSTITPHLSRDTMIMLRDASGRLLATGTLLQLGQRLMVRIVEIFAALDPARQHFLRKPLAVAADQVEA